ncbi:AfsA-related hotdog domain-containing protein [Streptosporangium sp. NPDC051022]|uniref:AfsA-related hotdog domain-containing protein n=1 Tax=Streptosporangium sp. NPDC051022 TaxID=3155752 RepID=UPI003414E360
MVSHSHPGTSLDTPAPDRLSVVTPVAGQAGRCGAVLRVDRDHPFFFDHPLDHVPGMLLVTGLLELVRTRADLSPGTCGDGRIRLSLTFVRMCELDGRVVLLADPPAPGGCAWTVRAVQDDVTVCSGTVEPLDGRREPQAPPYPPGRDLPVTPVARDLVHRVDPRNVLVGEPVISGRAYDASLLSPPSGHFLLRRSEEYHGAEEMIEAGRQLLTVASHLTHGRPRDTMMVWLDVTADLPARPPRSVPLALHWPVRPARGNFGTFGFTLVTRDSGRPLGSLSYGTRCLTPAAYRRLRRNGGRA